MASITITRGTTLPNSSSKSDFHNLVDTATASITGIVNADVDSAASISASKLDLSSVAQVITMTGKAINEAEGANIASASTTNIWATDGNTVHITGTTTITSLSTAPQAGAIRRTIFDGALTLTHNASTLILPGGANITTAAGDVAIWYADTTTQIRCISYLKADGTPVVSGVTVATQAQMEAGTNNTATVTPLAVNWHPGVAKAWGRFNGTGTPAFDASYNFDSSITDNGTGDYTISFTTGFSSANYSLVGTAGGSGNPENARFIIDSASSSPAAGTIRVAVTNTANARVDSSIICIVAFGDQA